MDGEEILSGCTRRMREITKKMSAMRERNAARSVTGNVTAMELMQMMKDAKAQGESAMEIAEMEEALIPSDDLTKTIADTKEQIACLGAMITEVRAEMHEGEEWKNG